jgi:N-acetylneuraminic acid mutarotase
MRRNHLNLLCLPGFGPTSRDGWPGRSRFLFALVLSVIGTGIPAYGQGTWATVAPLPNARSQMGVTEGPDGRVYAIGGLTTAPPPYNAVNIAQAYNPANNTWVNIANLPTARYNLAVVSTGGLVYAIGGYSSSVLGTVETYNPATNAWTTAPPLPTPRQNLTAAVGSDGRIYAIGGSTDGGATTVSTVEAYNPTTRTWASGLTPMPTPRQGMSASMGNDGLIYVMGGLNNQQEVVLATVEAYNATLNSWSSRANMPTARTNPGSAVAADGTVYVFGGQLLSGQTLNTVEGYTASTNHWSTATSMPTARAPGGAAAGSDGRIYAVGGFGFTTGYVPLGVVEAFAPTLNTITTLLASPNPSAADQDVTLTATVSPNTATGTVTFLDGQSTIGAATLSNGAATLTLSTLPQGLHSLTAVYGGDTRDFTSTSAVVAQTVVTTICTYSLTPSSVSVIGGASSTSSFAVTAPSGCTWTAGVAAGSTGIVSLTNGSTGVGNGTVSYSLNANPNSTARTAIITVTGQNNFSQNYTINQAPAATVCTYTITQSSQSFQPAGGTGSVGIVTQGGCPWSVSTANVPWTTITSAANGTGNGTVTYSVPMYTSPVTRTGGLLIVGVSAGQPVTLTDILTQLGLVVMLSCTASLPPTGPAQIALEGRTEVLTPLTLTCTGVTTAITADITLALNTPVTNQVTAGLSDATLTNGAATQGAQVIGYSMLRWPAVTLRPVNGAAAVTLTNVRVDASSLAPPTGPGITATYPVTGRLAIVSAGAVPLTNPTLTLANAATTLVFQAGPPAPPNVTQEILQLSFQESPAAPLAFSSLAPATRLRAVVSNIPAGVLVYAPISSAGGAAKALLYATDCSGALGTPAAGISLAGGNYAPLTVTGGVATATWVVQSTTFGIDTLTFPVLLINPNGINLNVIQATGSLAPVSPPGVSCGSTDPSVSAVPRYRDFSTPPTAVFLRLTTAGTATRGSGQSTVAEMGAKRRTSPLASGSNVTLTFMDNVMNEGTTTVMNATVNGSVQTGTNLITCAANGGVGGTCTGYDPTNIMNTMQPGQYACTWSSLPPGSASCTGSGTEDPNANSQPTVPTSAGVTATGAPGDISATQASGLVTQDFGPNVQIENPLPGSVFGTVSVSGWAVDANFSVSNVQLQVDGVTQAMVTSFLPRQDICNAYSNYFGCLNGAGPNIGYSFTLDAETLTGAHVISVLATNANNPPVSNPSAPLNVNVQIAMKSTRVGVFRGGAAFIEDSNGNGAYDAGVDRFIANFTGPGGFVAGDYAVAGDWTGDGRTKVGIYRSSTGQWFLDANNNGVFDPGDFTYGFGGVAGDLPMVGDWTGVGKTCIGVFRSGFLWVLDLNCNGTFDGTGAGQDTSFPFGGISGDVPIVGAWTGKNARVGVIRKYAPGGVPIGNPFYWVPDSGDPNSGVAPANHQPDYSRVFAFGGLSGDVFVTGDWYSTGISVAGVYRNGLWVVDAAQPGDPQTSHNQPPLTFNYGGVAGDVPVTGKW